MQPNYRLSLFLFAAISVAIAAAPSVSTADPYPTRPVHIIVPFAPGGGIDFLARLTAKELTKRLGQQFIVDNRSGAGGTIGSNALAVSKPDGYTLIFQASSSAAVAPVALKSLPYDPIKAFAPVSLVGAFPTVLIVNNKLPVTNLQSFVELLRKSPGKYSYGSAGAGTISHLTSELFRLRTHTQILHVPYRGMTLASQDLMAGRITFIINAISAELGHIKGGLFRPLAVTSLERSPLLPDVPTMAESGLKDVSIVLWGAVFAPAGTPKDVIQKLSTAYAEIMHDPAIIKQLNSLGIESFGSTPDELDKFWKSEIELYRKIITDAGIKLE